MNIDFIIQLNPYRWSWKPKRQKYIQFATFGSDGGQKYILSWLFINIYISKVPLSYH
jgi:hypothetical protein